jgi:cyclophilin family peptidyl-prolyl cis-trans isomerase
MEVELFEKDKPITVDNFVSYVRSGKYRDSFIHRCNPTFVIQGGGHYVADRGTTNANITFIETFPPIKNEYGSGNIYSNRYGTIAMAKLADDTNSATSQWFFNLADNFFLDAHDADNYFTVFGKVIRGTNVLNAFRQFHYWQGGTNETNLIAPYGPPFSEMPLVGPGVALTESSIVYVDITLLNVQVRITNSVREISWNSVVSKTNRVEFTTNMPPVWNLLVKTNGSGNPMKVTDTASAGRRRFYRVTVDY